MFHVLCLSDSEQGLFGLVPLLALVVALICLMDSAIMNFQQWEGESASF